MGRITSIIALTFIITFLSFSYVFADDLGKWGYSKEIHYENDMELKGALLDEDVYRYAKPDLSDIRLIDSQNQGIPYYIFSGFQNKNKTEYVEYISEEILSFRKGHDYYVDYLINPIKKDQDIVGNKLVFQMPQENFYKEIEILGSHDNKNWNFIKKDMIYQIDSQEKNQVLLEDNYKYTYYRIISLNDATDILINHLNLVYDHTELIYDQYRDSKVIKHKVYNEKEGKETIIKIHNEDRLKVYNIKIKSNDDFNRDYKLYSIDDEGQRQEQITAGSVYRFNLESLQIEQTDISIKVSDEGITTSEYLELVISDRDDRPINIEEVKIDYFRDKIVFKTNDLQGIQLVFGNQEANKPDYDISRSMLELERLDQEVASLGSLVQRPVEGLSNKNEFNYTWILNVFVIAISVLLIILILRKKDN